MFSKAKLIVDSPLTISWITFCYIIFYGLYTKRDFILFDWNQRNLVKTTGSDPSSDESTYAFVNFDLLCILLASP